MKKVLSALLIALALPLAFTATAFASHCNTAQSVFGNSYTLSNGQTLNSNLVVFGGNVTIEENAAVNCTVVVFGGNVDIAGSVAEDVVVIGGSVNLDSTATVTGQVATVGGSTSRAEGATVKGGETQGFGNLPVVRPVVIDRFGILGPVWGMLTAIFNAIALGLLALVVVLFWPDHTARVSAAITNSPGATGGLGLLTLIAVPILLVVTAITICLIPFTLIGALLFVMAIIFGWIALGMVLGARLSAALNLRNLSPAVSAAMGTTLFTLVSSIVQIIIPCVGWLMPFVLACLGLGAVTLTRFGTRPYLAGMGGSETRPDAPPPPASDVTLAS